MWKYNVNIAGAATILVENTVEVCFDEEPSREEIEDAARQQCEDMEFVSEFEFSSIMATIDPGDVTDFDLHDVMEDECIESPDEDEEDCDDE